VTRWYRLSRLFWNHLAQVAAHPEEGQGRKERGRERPNGEPASNPFHPVPSAFESEAQEVIFRLLRALYESPSSRPPDEREEEGREEKGGGKKNPVLKALKFAFFLAAVAYARAQSHAP